MGMFSAMDTSATGMTAQRLRMDIISQNLANVNTTRGADGKPYRRKTVVFQEKDATCFSNVLLTTLGSYGNGVKVAQIVEDGEDFKMVYDPSHPDADESGYVMMPNVNTVEEMTNLIDDSRSYEANVTAFNSAKAMALKGLEVGK